MLWIGLCIGFSIGLGYGAIRARDPAKDVEIRRLEMDIAISSLERAREERRAAALRVIAENTRQAKEIRHD